MNRLAIVITTAIAIIWHSGCLSVDGWAIYNRCGLWYLFSQKPLVISLDYTATKVVEHTKVVTETKIVKVPSEPTVVYVPQAPATYGAPTTVCGSMPTSTTMSTMIYMSNGSSGSCATGYNVGTVTTTPYTTTTTSNIIMNYR